MTDSSSWDPQHYPAPQPSETFSGERMPLAPHPEHIAARLREPVPGAEVQPYGDQRSYPGQLLDARQGPADHACSGMWQLAGQHLDGHEVYRCDSGRHWLIGPDMAQPLPAVRPDIRAAVGRRQTQLALGQEPEPGR